MLPKKSVVNCRYSILLLIAGYCVSVQAKAKADSSSESTHHDPPLIMPNFYDPNYHDDGRNHMRGPTAASSSSTISIMSPYAAASSASTEYSKGGGGGSSTSSRGGGTIMAIVDHFYGPNGEEQVKYTNPTQMDKDEFEQILASLGSSGSTPSKLTYNSPSSSAQRSPKQHHPQYSPSSSPKLNPPPPPSKYGGSPLSSLYKSSSSPSYASTQPHPGYSLGSLYKSSSENSYSNNKPPATYRPAFSTIYKDPPFSTPSKSHHHFSKGSSEYSPSPYSSPKDSIVLHSPKEPSYLKGSSYYDSPSTAPKSISDAISADVYSKGYPPMSSYKGHSNVIDHDEGPPSYPYSHSSPSYPPPASYMSPHHPSHSQPHHHHDSSGSSEYAYGKYFSPSVGVMKDEYTYGKGPLKAGLHSLPVRYSASHGPEYGQPPPPPRHHETYSAGFGGGYSAEDSSDPYSRPKGYMKSPPPPYSSSTPSHPPGGHSLSSLYDPVAFDELYNSPKAKPMYLQGGAMSLSKPGYGAPGLHPGAYALSYGPPVEYHMPPKGIGYTTSSSPYGGPGLGSPKYKGPYRTVTSGPSGHASNGYGYGKPHSSHHDDERKTSSADGLTVAKDEYEDEPKYMRPSLPPPPTAHQTLSPPSAMPPHLLYEPQQPGLLTPPPPTSHEALRSHHLSSPLNSYLPAYPHLEKPTSVEYPLSHHPHHPYHHPMSQEISPNDISHSPPRHLSNNQGDSSEEVHHVHVFEKGFFGKEKRLRGKEKHYEKWRPVLRNYRFEGGSGEGGHGSASMERDAREAEEAGQRGRRHGPPPSRRTPTKTSKRPYHASRELEENRKEHERTKPPHPRHGGRRSVS